MAGQVKVTIGEKEWLVTLANNYWEQVQGLSSIPGMAPGTGMLFDLGFGQIINVTTGPMLFPLDIAFFSEAMEITEVYHNVQPGCLVASTLPARYFLEVNAGEFEGVESGSQASFQLLASVGPVEASDWVSPVISFTGFTLLGFLLVGLVARLYQGVFPETGQKYLLSESKKE
jgi:uncharacterized membrane protein (UPF0127 family)